MRYFNVFLLILLFSTSIPAESSERVISLSEKLQIDPGNNVVDPSRDPGPDWIIYDNGEPSGLIVGRSYWSKVTFTPEEPFQLQCLSFLPLNQGPNGDDACRVRVYSEDAEHNLEELLIEVVFAEVPEFGQNAELVFDFDDDQFINFDAGESFTIMYESPGMGNGGNEGDGWWNVYDGANDNDRSFYFVVEEFGDEPGNAHADWVALNGDLIVRANGEFLEFRDLNVEFRAGWNMISINVFPPDEMYAEDEDRGPDVVLMTEQLRRENGDHRLEIMKNSQGQFYAPAWGFNNIPYWDLTRGYQVKVIEELETVWTGVPIPFDMDIPMEEGWHIIAYFPTFRLDASAPDFYVLSPIIEDVFLAWDAMGRFMIPEWNFSNMIPWEEGQGYWVCVRNDVVLNYPVEREEGDASARDISFDNPKFNHWTRKPTDKKMAVIITSVSGIEITPGDQIGAFDLNGSLVGVGNIEADGRCGLAVWGDDETTDKKDGLIDGESFQLRLWSLKTGIESNLSIESSQLGQPLVYNADDFNVLSVRSTVFVPSDFALSTAYPNPFNNATTITFSVPRMSNVTITITDITGRLIKTLIHQEIEAGNHITTWNADTNPTGIYLVRMVALGFETGRKLLLVK